MRALTVTPASGALEVTEVAEPSASAPDDVVLRVLQVGVCGTDREIAAQDYGTPPAGEERLVLGHECLAEVVSAGSAVDGLRPGDLVVPMVRRPCAHAGCHPCRSGRADYCTTGDYTEHGIKERHGFMTELLVQPARWLHRLPSELRHAGVLTEPMTIAVKALAQAAAVQSRLPEQPGPAGSGRTAVVVGAGPVGLLGAMALLAQGYATWVYSRSPAPNDKADLAESLGARYVASSATTVEELRELTGPVDLVYEAAGVASVAFDVLRVLGPNGVYVFTGVARPEPPVGTDVAALNRQLVLGNQAVLGTVNAGAADYAAAVGTLASAARRWPEPLSRLVTGRHALGDAPDLLRDRSRGIKDVLQLAP